MLIFLSSGCFNSEIDPVSISRYETAKASYIKGSIDESLRLLKTLTEEYPSFIPALELQGRIFFFKGDYSEAEKYFLEALDNNPHHINSQKWLCRTYLITGRDEDAEKNARMLLKSSPEDPSILILMGRIMKEKKNYLAAMEYYKKSFLFDEEIAEARIELAEIYTGFALNDKAREELKKALNILGDDHALFNPVISIIEKLE